MESCVLCLPGRGVVEGTVAVQLCFVSAIRLFLSNSCRDRRSRNINICSHILQIVHRPAHRLSINGVAKDLNTSAGSLLIFKVNEPKLNSLQIGQ